MNSSIPIDETIQEQARSYRRLANDFEDLHRRRRALVNQLLKACADSVAEIATIDEGIDHLLPSLQNWKLRMSADIVAQASSTAQAPGASPDDLQI